MTVDLPSAVIGVRGTQVAGLLDENGEGDGLDRPRLMVAYSRRHHHARFGTQDVRGGFAVGVSEYGAHRPVPAPQNC